MCCWCNLIVAAFTVASAIAVVKQCTVDCSARCHISHVACSTDCDTNDINASVFDQTELEQREVDYVAVLRYQSRFAAASELCSKVDNNDGQRNALAIVTALKIGSAVMQSAIDGYHGEAGIKQFTNDQRQFCLAKQHSINCTCINRIKLCEVVLNNSRGTGAPISIAQLYKSQHEKSTNHGAIRMLHKLRYLPFTFIKVMQPRC